MTPIDALREEVRQLRAALREIVSERLPSLLFGWTLTSKSSAMGGGDAVQTADDDSGKGQRPVRRVEPFGLRSRAPSKLRALWIRLGASNVVFIGVAPSKGYGPTDLEDGEVAVYNLKKALIRLWKTGKITVDAESGQDVVINGGTAKVSRVGDTVDIGTFSFTPSSGTGVTAGQLVWTPPGGGDPVTISTGGSDLTGKITSGADHFKG